MCASFWPVRPFKFAYTDTVCIQTRYIFDEEAVDEADEADEEADEVEGDGEGEIAEEGLDSNFEVAEVVSVPEVEEPRLTASPEPVEKLALSSGLASPPIPPV